MSSNDDKSPDSLNLSPSERTELDDEQNRRLESLALDVQRRYDPSRLSRVEAAAAGRAEKLDDHTRTAMEKRLGARFHDVRIIRGAFADRVTRRHRADAVTVGATGLILLRDTPRTNTRTAEGKALLAHELTHVRQAQRGMHFAKEQGSEGAAHEQEAEKHEREVKAASNGKSNSSGPTREQLREKAIQTVLERMADQARLDDDRSGLDE